ncbi:MAG: T9SS type A sorting domain-containing protein [Vicingaceae bacterium]|nr:T9SS type A sorting domain-containing protein [Vicingaceae bacterium]
MKQFTLLYIVLVILTFRVNAQYGGGVSDGNAQVSLLTVACPTPITVYQGGTDDGHDSELLLEASCPTPITVYQGGIDDGHDSELLLEASCPTPITVYQGGIDDGHDSELLLEASCLTPITVYQGGIDDGHNAIFLPSSIPCNPPLPIELLSFEVVCTENGIKLFWTTVSEINNDFFTIERSPDLQQWEIVAKIPGAGNSSVQLNYTYLDNYFSNEVVYYRLKQTDFNGQFEYFDIQPIVCGKNNPSLSIYPNPFTETINISSSDKIKISAIRVVDVLGKTVKNIIPQQTQRNFTINLIELAKGFYYLNIDLDNKTETYKVIKN